ncbi:PucR family transcriptional regulator [Alkalicoccus urumqiensis]|uniref:PucR family transcriptional regulator n=1 Tax=Alkalicoccus urumqiensis TaxID=1548213 RepID=A0A2P6MLP5_ALKUR|nr:PucR family transcriptional regulator [Alkalicoccus urumqiensis]PRO67170.1 hypothetical protein C6I21_01015 [Alkalicoccus urumqiensis]
MNVEELYEKSRLQEAVPAAGKQAMHREVRAVTMMDAPDIDSYLEEGLFLVTTGYSMRETPGQLVRLVDRMASASCAGIGIKSARFLKGLPPELKEAAEERGLPLFDIPEDLSLGTLVNDMLALVLKSREAELEDSRRFHERLSRLLHQQDGLTLVMREVEKKLRRNIQLRDAAGTLLYARSGGEAVSLKLADHQEGIRQETAADGKAWSTYPVETGSSKRGMLVVEGEALPSMSLLLSQAANVVSFELMKQSALRQHERLMKNAFFNDVLEGRFTTNAEIYSRGRFYGLEEDTLYITAAAQAAPFEADIRGERAMYEERSELYEWLEQHVADVFPHFVLCSKGEVLVLFVGLHYFQEEVERQFADGLADLQTMCRDQLDIGLSFGIGSAAGELTELSDSWTKAVEALQAGMQLYSQPFIQSSRTRGMRELLHLLPKENRRSFLRYRLRPLRELEAKEERTLTETLRVYLDHQSHIGRTAEILGVHRNTVLFRLKKLEELFGEELKSPEGTLELRLALFLEAYD